MKVLNLISRCFGKIANINFPAFIQHAINKAYVKHFDIDLSSFDDYKNYPSLNALFTRKLLIKRELESGFISPCDGEIISFGGSFAPDEENLAFSVKNHIYSIDELLNQAYVSLELKGGLDYANIYLSPRDYHHYHAPCDLEILQSCYVPGALFSVGKKALFKHNNLYAKNERVILKCKINKNKSLLFWLVFVGATNVGKMRFSFDTSIQTNAKCAKGFVKSYDKLFLKKGDNLGNFEMGSTILVIAQKGLLAFDDKSKIKFGEKIASIL